MRRRSIVEAADSLGAAVTAAGLADFPAARESPTLSPDQHAAHQRLEPWFEEVNR